MHGLGLNGSKFMTFGRNVSHLLVEVHCLQLLIRGKADSTTAQLVAFVFLALILLVGTLTQNLQWRP